jgi:pyruvate dehydrogenase E1 component beta subunit
MFVEHRWVYNYIGYVPQEMYTVPIGKGIVRKEGKDVTVVAISQMVYEAMKAAKILGKEGIDIEIIDPRTLKPLDEETIFNSVKKTRRLVIADVACRTGGVGAEIACRVAESVFEYLKAPVRRVNFPDVPTPNSPVLEEAYYPGYKNIISSVKELLHE